MIPLPKELPEWRDRMVAWMRSPYGRILLDHDLDENDPYAQGTIAERQACTWDSAALLHISAAMTELVMQAKEGIGDAGFAAHDLPVPTGVAVFGMPLSSRRVAPPKHRFDEDELALLSDDDFSEFDVARIRAYQEADWTEQLAVSWRDEPPTADHPARVRLTWWQEKHSWRESLSARKAMLGRDDDPHEWDVLQDRLGPYAPEGSSAIVYGAAEGDTRVEHEGGGPEHGARADMFRALCYLLRQRVAEETVVGPDRAARRRMKREGREPAPVRLISIRGASASGGGDGSREYVHRWIVRGHWRRQWYRSIQAHRPIWITPYVKGPEDAPLLGGEKVYTASARGSEVAS